jgi:hypothetical protein
MRIKPSHKKRRLLIGVLCLLLIVGGGLSAYAFTKTAKKHTDTASSSKKVNTVDYGPPTKEQVDAGDSTVDPEQSTTDRPLPPTPQPGGKSIVEVAISSTHQAESTFQVSTLISHLVNSGTCTLVLAKGTTTITKTAGVQPLASTSTCKGFSIPTSELSAGKWTASLTFENDTLTGSTEQTVEVK